MSIDGSSNCSPRDVHHDGVEVAERCLAPTAYLGFSRGTTLAPVVHESAGIHASRAAQESSPRSSQCGTRRLGHRQCAYCLLRDGEPRHQHYAPKLQCFSVTGVG